MGTKPELSRPGHSLLVPEVRISELGELQRGAERGTEMAEIAPDVLSVEVTRVNTGAGQYSITLNNAYDSLPADRHDGEHPAGQREVLRENRPLQPRVKYHDFALLQFGKRLRIDMRYRPPDPTLSAEETESDAGWVPMISGPITDMKFAFSPSEGMRLTVAGEEDFTRLKTLNKRKVNYSGKSEQDILRDVIDRADFPVPLAPPATAWPAFATDRSRALAEEHREEQSFLEFLQKLADRMDFEVFIEFADLADPYAGLAFHFEPSRSRVPPDRVLRDVFIAQWGKDLLDFTPTLKVVDQFTSVVVKGRHRVRSRPRRVVGRADGATLSDELNFADQLAPRPAPDWRKKLYRDNEEIKANQPNLDEERAKVLAESLLRRKAREFLTIQGTTVGLPLLRPGRYLEIRGLRPPFDGFYYVVRTVHTHGEGGLRTQFSARRPGMPFPPYGEGLA